MKKVLFFTVLWLLVFGTAVSFAGDPLEELLEEFNKEYNEVKPPSQYSSINSDYKLSQTALGTLYTTKAIGLLYRQNQELLEKYDEMLMKYDKIIEQNREIIKILSKIAKGQAKARTSETSEAQPGEWSGQ
jgi:uncharacterized protein with von Willebrand factor type A (vWA) domain